MVSAAELALEEGERALSRVVLAVVETSVRSVPVDDTRWREVVVGSNLQTHDSGSGPMMGSL